MYIAEAPPRGKLLAWPPPSEECVTGLGLSCRQKASKQARLVERKGCCISDAGSCGGGVRGCWTPVQPLLTEVVRALAELAGACLHGAGTFSLLPVCI